jgi:tetratricopeptide (TPR) repeat protein
MGIGGTLAVIGILLFLLIVYRALRAGKSTSISSPVATPQKSSRKLNMGNIGLPTKKTTALITLLLMVLMLAYASTDWSSGSSSMSSSQLTKTHDHLVEKRREEVNQRFNQGVVMLRAKQYDMAMTAFHRVIQLAPDMPEAYVNAGFALLGKKEYEMAADFFNDATKKNQNQLNAYYGLAVALEGMGNRRAAIEAMYAYLHQAPKDDPFRRKAEAAIWEWREALRKEQAVPKNKP